MIYCPYCNLPNWNVVQILRKTSSGGRVVLCRCSNCGKMFYLIHERNYTYTIKMEDVELL